MSQLDKKGEKVHVNRKYYDKDFSNQDLSHADFRGATLVNCNFDCANLSYATFEGANCWRSTFRQAKLYRTSFKDAVTAETIMDPQDMFGLTISVSCDTFDRMTLGKTWLAAWLYLPMLGTLPDGIREQLQGVLVSLVGEERFKGLERHFAERQM